MLCLTDLVNEALHSFQMWLFLPGTSTTTTFMAPKETNFPRTRTAGPPHLIGISTLRLASCCEIIFQLNSDHTKSWIFCRAQIGGLFLFQCINFCKKTNKQNKLSEALSWLSSLSASQVQWVAICATRGCHQKHLSGRSSGARPERIVGSLFAGPFH